MTLIKIRNLSYSYIGDKVKRIFEWIGGFALIAFSFYFTDRVSLLVASKSDLMEEIKLVSKEYSIDPIEAVINTDENTIIPGKFGKKVNDEESYLNMHDFGSFNENYLVYDFVKPKNTLEDNKDKYITSGNKSVRQMSLILEKNEELTAYLEKSNIKYDLIATTISDLNNRGEVINGANKTEFKSLHNSINDNRKICLKGYSYEEYCKKYGYYILMPKLFLQNTTFPEIKNKIEPGSIIHVSETTDLETLKLIINEIKYKDLSIVYISELLGEKGE